MSVSAAVYVARLGDLLHEAKDELDKDGWSEFLALAMRAVAQHGADWIETNYMDGTW